MRKERASQHNSRTKKQQHSSHSYPPQGQAHLHSYDNHPQFQDHAAAGRRRSSAISIPAGAADVSLNPHFAQGFLHHELVSNNNTPANHSGTSSVQQHGHPTTSHFCPVPVGQESNNISHSPNAPNEPIGFNAPNSPNGPEEGERGLGATLVGGTSGRFLAKQLGRGGGHHHGVLGTTAGAVAANLLEHKLKKNHDQKNHHQQTQYAHDLEHGHGHGGGGGLSGMFGGDGGGVLVLSQSFDQFNLPFRQVRCKYLLPWMERILTCALVKDLADQVGTTQKKAKGGKDNGFTLLDTQRSRCKSERREGCPRKPGHLFRPRTLKPFVAGRRTPRQSRLAIFAWPSKPSASAISPSGVLILPSPNVPFPFPQAPACILSWLPQPMWEYRG
ncbi:hypothetical protein B0T13DRAFT_500635 [Neurospora crassa]|nr:hypothetical protein B0T13DRAFT_500635 [Neurospora crassa]